MLMGNSWPKSSNIYTTKMLAMRHLEFSSRFGSLHVMSSTLRSVGPFTVMFPVS